MTKPNPFRRVLLIIIFCIVCATVCMLCICACAILLKCSHLLACVASALYFNSLFTHLIIHFRRYAVWLIIMQHRNTTNGLKFSFLSATRFAGLLLIICYFSANYYMVTHIPSNSSVASTCGIAICVCVCANGTF